MSANAFEAFKIIPKDVETGYLYKIICNKFGMILTGAWRPPPARLRSEFAARQFIDFFGNNDKHGKRQHANAPVPHAYRLVNIT